jgi:hypothetical protein
VVRRRHASMMLIPPARRHPVDLSGNVRDRQRRLPPCRRARPRLRGRVRPPRTIRIRMCDPPLRRWCRCRLFRYPRGQWQLYRDSRRPASYSWCVRGVAKSPRTLEAGRFSLSRYALKDGPPRAEPSVLDRMRRAHSQGSGQVKKTSRNRVAENIIW